MLYEWFIKIDVYNLTFSCLVKSYTFSLVATVTVEASDRHPSQAMLAKQGCFSLPPSKVTCFTLTGTAIFYLGCSNSALVHAHTSNLVS